MSYRTVVGKGFVAACLIFSAPKVTLSADILLGYGSHFDSPYAVMEDGALVDGWIYETARALSNVLRAPVSAVAIPRKRTSSMINNGEVDVYCFTNPAWAQDMRSVLWSDKLFDVSNLVIAKNGVAQGIRSPYNLRGLFVATILGNTYRPLTPFFENGQIQRVDTISFEQNLRMLKNGRVEAVIMPDTVAENLLSRLGMDSDYSAAPYVVSKRSLHCAISTADSNVQDRLNKAMHQLRRSGLFKWPELADRD